MTAFSNYRHSRIVCQVGSMSHERESGKAPTPVHMVNRRLNATNFTRRSADTIGACLEGWLLYFGIVGAAAVSAWVHIKRRHHATSWVSSSVGQRSRCGLVDIDDDTAADIIKRAKPELERAREVLTNQ